MLAFVETSIRILIWKFWKRESIIERKRQFGRNFHFVANDFERVVTLGRKVELDRHNWNRLYQQNNVSIMLGWTLFLTMT